MKITKEINLLFTHVRSRDDVIMKRNCLVKNALKASL